ncbi:MAG: hypothetical protein QM756_21795 [Polyangiaceae bacterium]
MARDLVPGPPNPEDTEVLRVAPVALDDVYARIRSGEITDVLTVTAVLELLLLRARGEL